MSIVTENHNKEECEKGILQLQKQKLPKDILELFQHFSKR